MGNEPKPNSGGEYKYWWMCVSNDEYRLPIAVADTADQLAEMLGVTAGTIRKSCGKRRGKTVNSQYIKVQRYSDETK